MKILIVEDEIKTAKFLKKGPQRSGFCGRRSPRLSLSNQ
jgi:DNA-binding response OmpR family regulator